MTYLQQVHGQVRAVVDGTFAVLLAEETAALGEEVEGTLRVVDLQAGNLLGQTYDEVLAALKGQAHVLHALLVAGKGCFGRFLAH